MPQSGGFTPWCCPSVCLFVCLFVCLSPRPRSKYHHRCFRCLFPREPPRISPGEIYACWPAAIPVSRMFRSSWKIPPGKNSSLKFMLAAGALVVPQFVTSSNEADVMWSFCLSFGQQDNWQTQKRTSIKLGRHEQGMRLTFDDDLDHFFIFLPWQIFGHC